MPKLADLIAPGNDDPPRPLTVPVGKLAIHLEYRASRLTGEVVQRAVENPQHVRILADAIAQLVASWDLEDVDPGDGAALLKLPVRLLVKLLTAMQEDMTGGGEDSGEGSGGSFAG